VKLLITSPWPERLGGAEAMLWTFLRHLDPARLQPTVVFYEPGPFHDEVATLSHVRTALVPVGRLREPRATVRAVRRLSHVLRDDRPDLILNWVAKAQLYGGAAAVLAGLGDRIVWWQHGIPDGHWMDRLATALPARAVGCSSSTAARAQRSVWPGRETFVVHPGVEAPAATPRTRESLGIPDGRRVVGIIGRLQPWKGQHRLLAALADLAGRGHDVHGLIVGGDAHGLSPEYAASLGGIARALGIAGRVTMTGHVADVAAHVAAMDVLVSASQNEPFGIVILEGMAQAIPVVAVADAGPIDIVRDGVTGVLVPTSEPADLAAGIERLLGDPVAARAMGECGRSRWRERFTAEAMTRSLQDALDAIEVGRRAPTAVP
jgi:glycosyltransferase involved in cell wall biosynthesis